MPDHAAKVVLRPDDGFTGAARPFLYGFGALFLGLAAVGEAVAAKAVLMVAIACFVAFRVFAIGWRVLGRREVTDAVLSTAGRDLVVEGDGSRVRLLGSSITTAYVVPLKTGMRLVFYQGRWPVLHAELPTRDEARSVLAELGLSPLERPVRFHFFFGMLVTVGIDGVLVEWPLLRRKRFVPHDRIENIRATDEEVVLELRGGDRYVISTNPGKDEQGKERHAALVERLLHARDAYAASEGGASLAMLARQGRTTEAWVKAMRASGEAGGAQYRSASLPVDALWRVALDPAEREELRVGAGLALRSSLDAPGREKLRLAAEASASPKVRVALVAAADEADDEAVVRAIDGREA